MAQKLLSINGAIHLNYTVFKGRLLKKQLLKESALVTTDSMVVLEEFERFEEEFPLNDLSAWDRGE